MTARKNQLPRDASLVGNVAVIDVMRPYLREAFGGPEHDFRLEVATPTGGVVCFHAGATADDIAAYWQRKGWLPQADIGAAS